MKPLLTTSILCLFLLGTVRAQEEEEWETTPSGLKYQVLQAGEGGAKPKPGDHVKVHYTGTLTDGKQFDSSVGKAPFEFVLGVGQVIEGWDQGVALMTVGSKFRFRIPWKLAYGEKGMPPHIGPKADLIFVVELLGIEEGEPLAVFREADPEKQKTTESGLKYEVLEEGEGECPKPDQGVSIRFTLWNTKGQHVLSTVSTGVKPGGVCGKLRLGPFHLKFLPEAVALMKPGARFRFEVPPELAFGDRVINPVRLPGNSVTVWEIELLKINEVPEFSLSDPEKTTKTASGLVYEVIREGEGKHPLATDKVTVHYTGWLTDGTLFDSSHARGETTSFPLNRVIRGWTEGLQLMRPGAIYKFTIPGNLAYGPRGRPPVIPANATLVFLVELVRIGE